MVPEIGTEADALVGRSRELLALDELVLEARSGHARIVHLEGEVGIGKSRLLDALVERAARRGFGVVRGAGRLGSLAPYDSVWSGLRHLPGVVSPATCDHLSFLVSVRDAVTVHLARGPLVWAVDDLHWADGPSCDVLEYVLAADPTAIRGRPLLVAIATRPGGLRDAARPAVARLASSSVYRRLTIGALDDAGLSAMISTQVLGVPALSMIRTLRARTGGNPLLVRAALVLAAAEGAIDRSGVRVRIRPGRWSSAVSPDLDGTLRALLDGLSAEGATMVSFAAALGAEGRVSDLVDLVPLPVDRRIPALDEANRRGVLADDEGVYRFVHPEMCAVAERYLGGAANERHHTTIAAHLKALGGDDEVHCVALDRHLRQAGSTGNDRLSVSVALAAARVQARRRAFDEASSGFRRVLEHVDVLGLDDHSAAALFAEAASASWFDCDPERAAVLYGLAADRAERSRDDVTWAVSVEGYLRSSMLAAGGARHHPVDDAGAHRLLAALGDRLPDLRARVLVALADLAFDLLRPETGKAFSEEALRLADAAGADRERALGRYSRGLLRLASLEVVSAGADFRACREIAAEAGDDLLESWGLDRLCLTHWLRGDLGRAGELVLEALAFNALRAFWQAQSLSATVATAVSLATGDLFHSRDMAALAEELVLRSDYSTAAPLLLPHAAAAYALAGEREGAEVLLDRAAARGEHLPRYLRALVADAGEPVGPVPCRTGDGTPRLFDVARPIVSLLASSPTAPADPGTVRLVERALGSGLQVCPQWPVLLTRALGRAAMASGDLDLASSWFAQSEVVAVSGGFALEAAHLLLDRACLARALGQGPAAASFALACVRAAGELGLEPLRRRSLDVADTLHPRSFLAGPLPDRVLMYTDLIGSTTLNVRVGDDVFVALLAEHHRLVHAAAERHGGTLFHSTGDGFGVWFTDASRAVGCAFDVHRQLAYASRSHPEAALVARIGIAAGPVLPLEGDLYGLAVVRAVRICGLASREEVLVGREIADAVAALTYDLDERGPLDLKGFDKPEVIVSLRER